MSWTTDELRELMTERAARPPQAPDRVAAAQALARHRRRTTVGAGVLAISLAVVAGTFGLQWLKAGPTNIQRPQPAVTTTPLPQLEGRRQVATGHVGDLRITTNGPAAIPHEMNLPGSAFAVEVTVVNRGPRTWTGQVGVGLAGIAPDLGGYFDNRSFCCVLATTSGPGQPDTAGFAQALPHGRHVEGVMAEPTWVIGPGETTRFLVWMHKATYGIPGVPVVGWIPVLNPRNDAFEIPPLEAWPRVRWG